MATKNHYEILKVPVTATSQEIKTARDSLLLGEYHYDSVTGEARKWREERAREVIDAYEVLRDPERRRHYNRELGIGLETEDEVRPSGEVVFDDSSPPDAYEVDSSARATEEPLLAALGRLLWRILRAGARRLPWLLGNIPRVLLICGLLVVGVIAGSWALRSYSRHAAEQEFGGSMPDGIEECMGGSGLSVPDLPGGAEAKLDCRAGDWSVTFLDFSNGGLNEFFAQRVREVSSVSPVIPGAEGSCSSPGHVAPYRYTDDNVVSGRALCFVTPKGLNRIEWTEISSGAYGQATADRPYAGMYQWWLQQAGPSSSTFDSPLQQKVR